MLSMRLRLKSRVFWKTKETESISSERGTSRTSTPPTSTRPSSTSQNLGTRLAMVLLPPPDGPTSAIVSPSGIAKLTFLTAGASAPGYVKDTPSKRYRTSRSPSRLRRTARPSPAWIGSPRFASRILGHRRSFRGVQYLGHHRCRHRAEHHVEEEVREERREVPCCPRKQDAGGNQHSKGRVDRHDLHDLRFFAQLRIAMGISRYCRMASLNALNESTVCWNTLTTGMPRTYSVAAAFIRFNACW